MTFRVLIQNSPENDGWKTKNIRNVGE